MIHKLSDLNYLSQFYATDTQTNSLYLTTFLYNIVPQFYSL